MHEPDFAPSVVSNFLNSHTAWHREAITGLTERTLAALRDAKLLNQFYLAGGAGLALQIGHRRSRDLDFFANELFDEKEVSLQRMQMLDAFSLVPMLRTRSMRLSTERK